MIFNYTEKLEYIYHTYNFGKNCYYCRKKYTIMPDGKIFFSYYRQNINIPCCRKTFHASPADVKLLYLKVRFLIRCANCKFYVHNDCGSRIKISYRLKNHETAYHWLAFGIFGSKTPVSKIITADTIMKNFISRHCYETFYMHKTN